MARTYIITFDLLDPTADSEALKEFVKTTDLFENWWNHIPGVFLVVSESNPNTISDAVRRYTKDARLLVMEVSPSESDGWLALAAPPRSGRRSVTDSGSPCAGAHDGIPSRDQRIQHRGRV